MKTFECPADMEVSGNVAMSMLTNMQAESFQPYLRKYGLDEIHADRWYPFQDVLAVYRDVSAQRGSMFDLVAAGLAAAERYPVSSDIRAMTTEQFFLDALPNLPSGQYRNGKPTEFEVAQVDARHLKIRFVSAYPDDTIYGFVYSFARRIIPRKSSFVLSYDSESPRRDAGGAYSTLDLTWQ